MLDRFELEDVLQTYRVVADTREQANPRAAERFAALGPGLERATLDYGDYCANVTLPDGKDLYNTSERLSPACIVERKMSLDEVAACFTRERERFKREFERAGAANAKIYLLIEGGSLVSQELKFKMKTLQVLQLLKMYWPVFPLVFLAGLVDAIAGGGGTYITSCLYDCRTASSSGNSHEQDEFQSGDSPLYDPFCNFRLYTSAYSLVCGTLCACRLMGGLQSESDDQQ